jgi:hypothetical protein
VKPSLRGAALPETALVLTMLLALLVGSMRVAIVGYEQVTADGAAFYSAHEAALKNTAPTSATGIDPVAATENAFPHAASDTIGQPSTAEAPDPNVVTDYGFDQTSNRHGGVSLIEPIRTIATVTRDNLAPLTLFGGGSVLHVTGVAVEPSFLETGIHGNINGDQFNSASSFTNAADYFSHGENTPPYFGGFHYLQFCNVPDDPSNPWNACPTGISFLALGLAEYLDADNWGRTPTGVAPMPQAVFWETLYHQQTFANISQQLPASIDPTSSNYAANLAQAQSVLNHDSGAAHRLYTWDSAQQGGYPDRSYVPGSYPLTPGAGYGG